MKNFDFQVIFSINSMGKKDAKYFEFPFFSFHIYPLNSLFPIIWVQKAEKRDEERKNEEKGEL